MIPEKLMDVLKHEGAVAIASQGDQGPHLINSWNSYVKITDSEELLIPAGGMKETEENVDKNNEVKITVASHEVEGFRGMGTGFLICGKAEFATSGAEFDSMKESFPWMRAVLKVKISSVSQKL
ncbi:hypothetical protein MNBD_NITROSPINAE03-537 [hydrothermal vent metagenome]|uniref:Pyridoxamine 5'-phosphate oxidase N-terminal domain-containing protein n=1 Tax=hydrothermal vent metagenome TaxID=652676 RepID=A0A3B1BC73_9ZZZZ